MTKNQIAALLKKCSFVRTGGSREEEALLRFFESYLSDRNIRFFRQPFQVPAYQTIAASFTADGKTIPCRPIFGFGKGKVSAPLYYLRGLDRVERSRVRGKIVLLDGALRASVYDFLVEAGALAVVACCGDANYLDAEIDQRARAFDLEGKELIPCAMVHAKELFRLVMHGAKRGELEIDFETSSATSYNLIVDLPGTVSQRIDVCAHYDSTSLSVGSYDNLSGCLVLLYLAEHFKEKAHERSIRLVFFGSEEMGLCGSLYYCSSKEMEGTALNINLDMIGSTMGAMEALSCADEEMEAYLKRFMKKHRVASSIRHGVRSSDSTSYTYFGVPAVSIARYSPESFVRIHTLSDRPEIVSPSRLLEDMRLVADLTEKTSALDFPVPFVLSEHVIEESKKMMKRRLMPPFSE